MIRYDFTPHLDENSQQLKFRYAQVLCQLAGLHEELAQTLAQEHREKSHAWIGSSESTIAARDRAANHQSLELTCTAHELRGSINALTEEKTLLHYLLTSDE